MAVHTKASPEIRQDMQEIKESHHPHLAQALIALSFNDGKPYVKDRLNLGKVSKFSQAARLWLPEATKYDFSISLCADTWFGILNNKQRRALLDLRLSQCQVEYLPATVQVNGKTQVIKDEYGRAEYTKDFKTDDEGRPVWKVAPLDLAVFTSNVQRFGVWFEDLSELKNAIQYQQHEVA